jgi:peptide/nickel transport system substrate-binding protein
LAGALAVGLLASACGGGSSPGAAAPPTTAAVNLGATETTEKPAGKPTPGGQLSIGLDAETDDFNPAIGQWGPSSYAVANALFDPVVAFDDKGIAHPYLADSITANGDYTLWVIKLRPDVTFHDGSPVDAAALKKNLDNVKSSPLTAPAFANLQSIAVTDPLTVTVTMSRPWATFPATLGSQAGYVAAPSMIDAAGGPNAPIVGSGPFSYVDRQRDSFVKTKRNDHYWQKDKDGVALPYIDALDFEVMPDGAKRDSALAAGDINAMTVASTAGLLQSTAEAANRGEVQRLSNAKTETDEIVLALNTSKPPFDDPLARQALAYGTDQDAMAEKAYHGALPGAWGLFADTSPYYISPQEAGYPAHDVQKAKSLAAEYQQAHGAPIEFTVLVETDPEELAVMQAYQADMATYGVKMNIESVETNELTSRVILSGNYQAAVFVMWSAPTPDQGYIFLATPANPNGISLNYSRYDDPEVVAALDAFRASGDPKERIEDMKRVQKSIAKNLQVFFLAREINAFVYANTVHGFTASVFPGTDVKASVPYPTTPFYTYVWKSRS